MSESTSEGGQEGSSKHASNVLAVLKVGAHVSTLSRFFSTATGVGVGVAEIFKKVKKEPKILQKHKVEYEALRHAVWLYEICSKNNTLDFYKDCVLPWSTLKLELANGALNKAFVALAAEEAEGLQIWKRAAKESGETKAGPGVGSTGTLFLL